MTWVRSSNGAVVLSFVALLSLLARSCADTGFIMSEYTGYFGTWFTLPWIVGWTAIAGGWTWALMKAAEGGSRGVWITLFAYALITALGLGAASLVAFPNFVVISTFWFNLVAGLLAAIAAGLQLWGAESPLEQR